MWCGPFELEWIDRTNYMIKEKRESGNGNPLYFSL
nr:MAG TPA: hypothetical protein [Caudoviricetes sp.]